MSLNYTSYVSQVANMMPVSSADANFNTMLPGMIDYSEQRIYRELDLLYTQVTDSTTSVSSGNRFFSLPTSTGTYIVCDNINIITPAGTPAASGTRVQLTPTSREFLDIAYPSGQTATGVPEFYAMASNTQVIFGPAPDASYVAEVIGVQRPPSLSASNSSTILTQYVPDLFFAASMVFAAGYMRDFGAQGADNPAMGTSWETQFGKLFASAQVEQARAKFQAEGWTSDSPSPIATPKRT
jgi:hypothetical protein